MFEELSSANPRVKYAAAKELLATAYKNPASLHPHFDFFEKLLDSDNKILRWTAIDILGHLAGLEKGDRTEKLNRRLFGFLRCGNLITANHAISALSDIASAHPRYRLEITRELLKVEHYTFDTEECRNIALGKVILAIGSYYDAKPEQAGVIEFVRRQTRNERNGTARKARAFLKKHARTNASAA